MLSGETAYGKYPVEAVKTMAKIAAQAEKDKVSCQSNAYIYGCGGLSNAAFLVYYGYNFTHDFFLL